MKTVITLILLAILAMCAWSGYKKGLIMGVGALLAITVSVYGANLLATAFSYDIIPALRPFAAGYMEQQIDAENGAMARMGWKDSEYSAEDLLAQHPERREEFCQSCYEALGVHESAAKLMAADAVKYEDENGSGVVNAVIQIFSEKACYIACFILGFLLILILLTVIGNLPNLSYKIPNLDILNDVGGTLLGIAEGVAFCMLLVWALRFTGKIIGEDTLDSSWLAAKFIKHDLIAKYLGI